MLVQKTCLVRYFSLPLLLLACLIGCDSEAYAEEDYSESLEKFERYIADNKMGDSVDYWLEKNTTIGWEKLVLVFGFADDFSVCQVLAELKKQKYPAADYRCTPANR